MLSEAINELFCRCGQENLGMGQIINYLSFYLQFTGGLTGGGVCMLAQGGSPLRSNLYVWMEGLQFRCILYVGGRVIEMYVNSNVNSRRGAWVGGSTLETHVQKD